jgi:hypothetical protein
MAARIWIIIAVLVLIILLGLIAFVSKKKKHSPDYKTYFILGVIWLPIGVATGNPGLWILGLVFMALGLANKSKWREHKVTKEQRKFQLIAIIVGLLTLLVLVGVFLYLRG